MKTTLHLASPHYGAGLVLHTASSGSVEYLDALYLRLTEDGKAGVGETRINIAYLNGLDASAVLEDASAGKALQKLAQASPLTLMLDESLQSQAGIDALIELSGLPVPSTLKRYPLSRLKIDQTFVRAMLESPPDAAVVPSILYLGHSFGLEVIAEGVEPFPYTPRWPTRHGNRGTRSDMVRKP